MGKQKKKMNSSPPLSWTIRHELKRMKSDHMACHRKIPQAWYQTTKSCCQKGLCVLKYIYGDSTTMRTIIHAKPNYTGSLIST